MNTNKDIQNLYFTLFILLIVEIILFLFIGLLMAIVVFIISIIIYSKFPKNCVLPKGLKLALITSSARIIMPGISIIFMLLNPLTLFLIFFCYLIIYVYIIVACVKVYKEYTELFN